MVTDKIQAMMAEITESIRTALDMNKSQQNSKETLDLMKTALTGIVKSWCAGKSDIIDFELKPDPINWDSILVIPNNLFTGLLFQGEYVPPWILGNKDCWEVDTGTYYFDKKAGFCFKPLPPIDDENLTIYGLIQ